jgi:hypothetical protein
MFSSFVNLLLPALRDFRRANGTPITRYDVISQRISNDGPPFLNNLIPENRRRPLQVPYGSNQAGYLDRPRFT